MLFMDRKILILGIGNILWADEGFGVRVVEQLASRWTFPPQVELMDGGTQGLYLLPHLEGVDRLIITDAVDFGLPPATLHIVEGDAVPVAMAARKMSLHQTGFQEVLALLHLRGVAPRRIALVGVQPVTMEDYGGGLTPRVAAQVAPAARAVIDLLEQETDIRPVALAGMEDPLMPAPVARNAYEMGRPDAESACRIGDERLLVRLDR